MTEDYKDMDSFIDDVKEYINTRAAQFKLSLAEKLSRILAYTITFLLLALVFFLVIVLIAVSAAIFIGEWLGYLWLGFLIMALMVIVLSMILWSLKEKLIQLPIMNKLLEVLFEDEEQEK